MYMDAFDDEHQSMEPTDIFLPSTNHVVKYAQNVGSSPGPFRSSMDQAGITISAMLKTV
jgi:hypothetical protein